MDQMAVLEKKLQWHGINVPELIVFWKQAVYAHTYCQGHK